MKCKRLLSLLLPTVVTLSACQQVMAMDHLPEEAVTIAQDVDSYHQVITIRNETETKNETGAIQKEELYSITEATLFPEESLAYGSRITKKTGIDPTKIRIYGSKEGAFQQKDNGEWEASATAEPLLASLEVLPYDSFIQLTKIFAQKGTITESNGIYTITYTGSDMEINQKISSLLQQFPSSHTVYQVTITVNKEDHHLLSFSLLTDERQANGQREVTHEINSLFSKYNLESAETKMKDSLPF